MQDNNNIGNRLQNYALYQILTRQNVNVSNLDDEFNVEAFSITFL